MQKIHATVHLVCQFYFSSYFDTKRKAPIYEYSYTSAFIFCESMCIRFSIKLYNVCIVFYTHQ